MKDQRQNQNSSPRESVSVLERHHDAFLCFLHINELFLNAKDIDQKQYRKLLIELLTIFGSTFGIEQSVWVVIKKILQNNLDDVVDVDHFLLVKNLLQNSGETTKIYFFQELQNYMRNLVKQNTNPMKQLNIISRYCQSVTDIYYDSASEMRENIYTQTISSIENILTSLEQQVKNKGLFKKEREYLLTQLQDFRTSKVAKTQEEVRASFGNSDDMPSNYESLIDKIKDQKMADVKICRTFLNAYLFLQQKYITENNLPLSYAVLLAYFESLPPEKKESLMFQLGFFHREIGQKLARQLDNNYKCIFNFGTLAASAGVLPYFTTLHIIEPLIFNGSKRGSIAIAPIHLKSLPLLQWDQFLKVYEIISSCPVIQLPQLINFIIILQSFKKQAQLLGGTMNIEDIVKQMTKILSHICSDKSFVKENLWLLKLIVSSLPTRQSLVTEYRITAWNWFKAIAELHTRDVDSYEGPEKKIIYYLHDSPGPYLIEVVRTYYDFLMENDDFSNKQLNEKLKPLNVKIDRNYVERFGGHFEEIQVHTLKLLHILEELYGGATVKSILEIVKNIDLPAAITVPLLKAISRLTKYSLQSPSDITQRMISRCEVFEPQDYPLEQSFDIFKDLINISKKIFSAIPRQSPEVAIHLLSIHNSLDAISYKFLLYFSQCCSLFSRQQICELLNGAVDILSYSVPSRFIKEINIQKKITTVPFLDFDKPISDAKRFYFIWTNVYELIGKITTYYAEFFQARIENLEGIEENVTEEFTADLIRQTNIYVVNLLAENFLTMFSGLAHIERYHITADGKSMGRVVIVPAENLGQQSFVGDEILITDNIDTHAELPHVAGIITKVYHQPLSHIAIHARERQMPWYSPPTNEFQELVNRFQKVANAPALICALPGKCDLIELSQNEYDQLRQGSSENKKTKLQKLKYIFNSALVLKSSEYAVETVGNKAYHLRLLSDLFPNKVPQHFALSFELFEVLMRTNQKLHDAITDLRNLSYDGISNKIVKEKLLLIQELIHSIHAPNAIKNQIKEVISNNFSNKRVIIRSSTNAEDLAGHAAAGVYESKIVQHPRLLLSTILSVLSSFYSYKAWSDRRTANLDEHTCFMGAIIQELIEPAYAFVVHTWSPIGENGNDKMLVEIVPGLGESLVSGLPQYQGETHKFEYDRKNGKITRISYLTKEMKKLFCGDLYVRHEEDLFYYSDIPLDRTIREVFQSSLEIENIFSKHRCKGECIPQDIEGLITFV